MRSTISTWTSGSRWPSKLLAMLWLTGEAKLSKLLTSSLVRSPSFCTLRCLSRRHRFDLISFLLHRSIYLPAFAFSFVVILNSLALLLATCTSNSYPGFDHYLASALKLPSSLHKTLISGVGCSGGLAILRIAKTIAEGDPRARVLCVACEVSLRSLHLSEV